MSWILTTALNFTRLDGTVEKMGSGCVVDDDHPAVAVRPDLFRRPRMTAEEQCRIRDERLAELRADQRQPRQARSKYEQEREAEALFWQGVERLLGTGPTRKDAESSRFYDAIDEARAATLAEEREHLSDWLDGT